MIRISLFMITGISMLIIGSFLLFPNAEKPLTEKSFLDFSIDPHTHNLKLYDSIEDISKKASAYKASRMPWFYSHKIVTELDSNDVPIVDYPSGRFRNPVTTCQMAFVFYNQYLETNNPIAKQGFLNNTEWLMENHDSNWYFRYEFEYTHHPAPSLARGWISGMAQGEALGVMSLAFHLTGEQKYLEAANGIFETLHTNSKSDWCFGVDNQNYYWLEEYPTRDFCHVLNGKLFGLWGLWNYFVITSNEFALTLFKAGIKSIVEHYSKWNVKEHNLSYYCWHYASISSPYHQIHLTQLKTYADFFDIPEFRYAVAQFSHTSKVSALSN